MSATNEAAISSPGVLKELSPTKKSRFHRETKQNKSVVKQVAKGCFNCNHHLTKYYYWKQSPCDTCCRSPQFYYQLSKKDIPDNWELRNTRSTVSMNSLY